MRLVIQRVMNASVNIGEDEVSSIEKGLLVLVGVESGDTEEDMRWLAGKTVGLRIFDDEEGAMNRSVLDIGGDILAVSQFTLTASTKRATARDTSVLPDTTSQYLYTKGTAKPYQAHSARKSAAEFSAPTCRSPSSTTARHHHHRLPTEDFHKESNVKCQNNQRYYSHNLTSSFSLTCQGSLCRFNLAFETVYLPVM